MFHTTTPVSMQSTLSDTLTMHRTLIKMVYVPNRNGPDSRKEVSEKAPAMQENWVLSLSWEDPLEKGMATHSSILAWRIPWTEEPGGLQSMGSQRVGHD